ncbi:hypothetical protein [Methylobacterium sp. JK268]
MSTRLPRSRGWAALESTTGKAGSIPLLTVTGEVETPPGSGPVYLAEAILPEIGPDALVLCLRGARCPDEGEPSVRHPVSFKKREHHRSFREVVVLWNGTPILRHPVTRPH